MDKKKISNVDTRAVGNARMRKYDVADAMIDEMKGGEMRPGIEERLNKVGRESDAEFIRETRGLGVDPGQLKKRRPNQMKEGGKVSSASKRADGCAVRGKTKGKMV